MRSIFAGNFRSEETGRICFGSEIDPLYVDFAIRRWQARTACDAVHAVTGELFSDRAMRIATREKDGRNGQRRRG